MYAILAIPLAWVVAMLTAAGLAYRGQGGRALRVAGAATVAAPCSLTLILGGFLFGLFGGMDLVSTAGQFAEAVLGAWVGFLVGYRLLSLRGRSRAQRVGVLAAASAIYWFVALLFDFVWLFINIMGDCFDSVPCQQHKAAALPQTGVLLLAFVVIYVALFLWIRRWLAKNPAPVEA